MVNFCVTVSVVTFWGLMVLTAYVLGTAHKHKPPTHKVVTLKGRLHKGTEDAACYDLFAHEDVTINPGEQAVVPTGLVTEMWGCDAIIFSRSGLAAKNRITHRAGVIDEKYPGEWGVVLVNEGREPFIIRMGDKIAQCMFVPKSGIPVYGNVTTGGKRVGGFGSTGV